MKAQDYPIAHFEFMSNLVESLENLPAQLLDHEYHAESFGSWVLSVRYKGNVVRFSYDGKDYYLSVRYSPDRKAPYGFGPEEEIGLDEIGSEYSQATIRSLCDRIIAPPSSWPQGAA